VKGYVMEAEYIATGGRKLAGYFDINTFNGRLAKGYATTRINTNIGADNYRNNGFSSNYNAMQIGVRKNFGAGLGYNASYTWSRALDNLSDVFNGRGTANPTDTMNLMADYGPADFNMKHRFVASIQYDLPFFKQNHYVGGWGVNTIIGLQGGVPFSPFSSSSTYDANKNGTNNDRVVYTGSGGPMNSVSGSKSPADGYFTTSQWARYVCPASVNSGLWCDPPQGRGTMTGPGLQNVDLGITKTFRIPGKENLKIQMQGNFFNLFNHPNFALSSTMFNQTSSSFGRSTSAFSGRITQLALRIDF
jgi:hypothetical protein